MRTADIRALFIVLPLCIVLQACNGVTQRIHDHAAPLAAVKVFPFYEGSDGEKRVVPGLDVGLFPERKGSKTDVRIAATDESGPLLFEGLAPGPYELKIYVKGKKIVSEELDLRAGRRVTVRVDFVGIDSWKKFIDRLERALADEFIDLAEEIITILLDNLVEELIEEITDNDNGNDDEESGGKKKKRAKESAPIRVNR